MRVKDVNAIARARPDAAVAVAADPIRTALIDLAEDLAAQHAAILAHLEAANQPRRAGVGDVQRLLIRRKRNAVWLLEKLFVKESLQFLGLRIQAIDPVPIL